MSEFPNCTIWEGEQRTEVWFQSRVGKLTASRACDWLADEQVIVDTVAELKALAKENDISLGKGFLKDDIIAFLNSYDPSLLRKEWKAGTLKSRSLAASKILNDLRMPLRPDQWEVDPDGPPPKNNTAFAIWLGIKYEEDAKERFQKETGLEVEDIGFCYQQNGIVGCSPDGKIKGQNKGLEIKVPNEKFIEYLVSIKETGEIPAEYKAQVHFSMAVTGADSWYFMVYMPSIIEGEEGEWINTDENPCMIIEVKRDDFTERMVEGIEELEREYRRQGAILAEIYEASPLSESSHAK